MAQATGYYSDLERFGRRPGTTCFAPATITDANSIGRGLEPIAEGKEGSGESVAQLEKGAEKETQNAEVAKDGNEGQA